MGSSFVSLAKMILQYSQGRQDSPRDVKKTKLSNIYDYQTFTKASALNEV